MYFPQSTSTGLQTALTKLVYKGPCSLSGIDVIAPTSGLVTVTVYDGVDTSGLVLSEVIVDAGQMSCNHEYFAPVVAPHGIYVTMVYSGSGSGASWILRFFPG